MIEEATAILGIDPDKYTLAEMLRMANRKIRFSWEQTSAILATLLNCNRIDGKTVEWDAFVPMSAAERRKREEEAENARCDPAMRPILRKWLKKKFPSLNKENK